jgi:hypothetical protein
MSDPLLEALRILPRLFALTAKGLSPISIRDQMVRAQMLVTRALEQGEITRDDKVLVVGAGAAGAVAAMTCASGGLDTVIIDRKSQPFLRQAGCATRWIDPMQYGWPADQWSPGRTFSPLLFGAVAMGRGPVIPDHRSVETRFFRSAKLPPEILSQDTRYGDCSRRRAASF